MIFTHSQQRKTRAFIKIFSLTLSFGSWNSSCFFSVVKISISESWTITRSELILAVVLTATRSYTLIKAKVLLWLFRFNYLKIRIFEANNSTMASSSSALVQMATWNVAITAAWRANEADVMVIEKLTFSKFIVSTYEAIFNQLKITYNRIQTSNW